MRVTNITDTGLVDRLRSEVDYPMPCPQCSAATTALTTETTFHRGINGAELRPGYALLKCCTCEWWIEANNRLYEAWGNEPKRS